MGLRQQIIRQLRDLNWDFARAKSLIPRLPEYAERREEALSILEAIEKLEQGVSGTARPADLSKDGLGDVGWFSRLDRTRTEAGLPLLRRDRYLDSLESSEQGRELREATRDIMDHLGDPARKGVAKGCRKGLVLGHVQSGKTANFITLACAAADAGYDVIIILGGIVTSLRLQTWERIIPGCVSFLDETRDGKRTNPHWRLLSEEKRQFSLVGMARQVARGGVADTGPITAFPTSYAGPNGGRTDLFLVLKNKTQLGKLKREVLDKLPPGKAVLVLDDECDEAGLPTTHDQQTSKHLDELLRSVPFGSYVGYTATPVANLISGPGAAAFPKDFLHILQEPGSDAQYLGVEKTFELYPELFLAEIPPEESSAKDSAELPKSLEDAILWYLMATATRRLRGGPRPFHSTMMVNVSSLNADQSQLQGLIMSWLERGFRDLARLKARAQVLHEGHERIVEPCRKRYEKDRRGFDEVWNAVLQEFEGHIRSGWKDCVLQYNMSHQVSYSDLRRNPADERRYIVIGGALLNRGRTLEGLVSSYFDRSVTADDSLEQMGRWFGWRHCYIDLCRVWMRREVRDAFGSAILANARAMRSFFRLAQYLRLTPEDLTAIFVTTPGRLPTRPGLIRGEGASIRRKILQTLGFSEADNDPNIDRLRELLRGRTLDLVPRGHLAGDFPTNQISDFIEGLQGIDPAWLNDAERLATLSRDWTWQVFIRSLRTGDSEPVDIVGTTIHPVIRSWNNAGGGGYRTIGVLSEPEDYAMGYPDGDYKRRVNDPDAKPTLIMYLFQNDRTSKAKLGCVVFLPAVEMKELYFGDGTRGFTEYKNFIDRVRKAAKENPALREEFRKFMENTSAEDSEADVEDGAKRRMK